MAAPVKKPLPMPTRRVMVGDLLRHKAKDLSVDFSGTAVAITYIPGLLTDEYTETTENQSHDLVNILCGIITEWDLADEDGDIPVGAAHRAEVSRRVPLGVLKVLYDAIVAENSPGE